MTLALHGIWHDYGQGAVLRGVDFTVRPGQVHALLGMNGAGKSTLVHIATGQFLPTRGTATVDGEPVRFARPSDASRHGVTLLAQEVDRSLVGNMTVHENLTAGLLHDRRARLFSARRNRAEARAILERYAVDLDPGRLVSSLSLYERQVLCLVRAAVSDTRYLMLDEPTSSFDAAETERFYRIVRELVADGIGIVFISHRLDEVFELADEITVLRFGDPILAGPTSDYTLQQVAEAIAGEVIDERRHSHGEQAEQRPVVLEAAGLTFGLRRTTLDLTLHAGEIVAVFGLLGTGKTSLAERLFGLRGRAKVRVDGREVRLSSPSAAAAAGIGLVPEERRSQGLWLDENVGTHFALGFGGLVRKRREKAHAVDTIDKYAVSPPRPQAVVRRLSGGNQQKVAIGKWDSRPLRVLIFDEPMKGVDVGAQEAIFQAIERAAADGVGIVYLTSEPDEALRIADRVITLAGGRVVSDLPAATLQPADLMLEGAR